MDTDNQLTIDVPSLNENGKLPVLDLEISMVQNIVKFEFYKKPISNPRVILYNSAISRRIKRDTLLQEGCRRMHNCSDKVSNEHKNQILSHYMNTLRISGYDELY